MNKALLSMVALGAIAAASPAAAQYANVNAGGAVGISNRIAQLDTRIEAGIRAGTITRAEARLLRAELRDLRRLERQYAQNGLTHEERATLQARIRDLRQDIRLAGGGAGDDRYADRYEDEDDVYAGRIDRNGDGWDDRDYDRDGEWRDDVHQGRGGPYENDDVYRTECRERGGLGGVLDNVLGRGDDCNGTTLRVGARATANLGAVPSQYRYRFRDGNGVYYRSDGRAVYQIDARSHTVLRVYDID